MNNAINTAADATATAINTQHVRIRRAYTQLGFDVAGTTTASLIEAAQVAARQQRKGCRGRDGDSVRVAIRRAYTQRGIDVRGFYVHALRALAAQVVGLAAPVPELHCTRTAIASLSN